MNDTWIHVQDLLKRWNINSQTLYDYVINAYLPVYDRNYRLLNDKPIQYPVKEVNKFPHDIRRQALIEYEEEREEELRQLKLTSIKRRGQWFKIEDIKLFESEHGITPVVTIEHLIAKAVQSDTLQEKNDKPEPASTVNFLTREGDVWHIGFEGQEDRIKHLDGLLYIAYLLEKPGTSILCRELYQAASGKAPEKIMDEGAAIDEGLNIDTSKQCFSDPKAKLDYAKEYQSLQNDLDDAESEMERQEIEKEMDAILPFLKERDFPNTDIKRFQSNVKKRLDTAYNAIGKKGGMK